MSDRIILKSRVITRSRGRLSGKRKIFEFDSDRRLLTKNGRDLIRLAPQEALVLNLLIHGTPDVIKNSELQEALWPGVDYVNDPQQRIREIVANLRAYLGDSASVPCFIENVPGLGYSFVGDLERPVAVEPPPIPNPPLPHIRKLFWRRTTIIMATGLVALALLVIVLKRGSRLPNNQNAQVGRFLVRSTSEGRKPSRIALSSRPTHLALSPDGKKLFAIGEDYRSLFVVDTGTRAVNSLSLPRDASVLTISPAGKLYIGSTSDGVMIVDTDRERVEPRIIPTGGPVRDMAITTDGERLFLALEHAGLKQMITRSGNVDQVSDRICPEQLALTPQGDRLYVSYQCSGPAGRPGHDSIELIDVATEASLGIVTGPPFVGGPISVSPDGKLVLLDGRDACSSADYDGTGCPSTPSHVVHLLRPSDRRILRSLGFWPNLDLVGFVDNSRFVMAGDDSWSVINATRYTVLERLGIGVQDSVVDAKRGRAYLAADEAVLMLELENPECAIPSAGLANYYPGDGAFDDAASIAPLTPRGAVRFVPGRAGQAFFLDGNSYLSQQWSEGFAYGNRDSTLALYVKFAATEGEITLVDTDNLEAGTRLFKSADGRLVFQLHSDNSAVKSKTSVKPNVWYHVAVAKADREVVLYIDGEPEGRAASAERFNTTAAAQFFGADRRGRSAFHGWLDEIAFYRRALTPSEVKAIYRLRESGPCKL